MTITDTRVERRTTSLPRQFATDVGRFFTVFLQGFFTKSGFFFHGESVGSWRGVNESNRCWQCGRTMKRNINNLKMFENAWMERLAGHVYNELSHWNKLWN